MTGNVHNCYPHIRLLPTHPHLTSADFIRLLPVATSAHPLFTHSPFPTTPEFGDIATVQRKINRFNATDRPIMPIQCLQKSQTYIQSQERKMQAKIF